MTVDVFNERSYAPEKTDAPDKTDTIDLTVTPVANVDENGSLLGDAGRVRRPCPCRSRSRVSSDGQWRITKAPNGIILDESAFVTVFHPYSLVYYDPTWTDLVPDVRWFPTTNAASRIVQALIRQKPSAWLAGSVATAFPDNVGVQPSVTNSAGTAQVELTGSPLSAEQTTLDRMLTQLTQSLATAGYSDVRMSFGSTPINASVILPTTTPPAQPVVLTAKGFGFYQSDAAVDPLPGLDAAVAQQQPNAIALAPDRQSAALRTAGGTVGAVLAGRAFVPLDTRPGLVAPTIDARGFVWTVPAGDPSAVRAVSAGGKGGSVAGAWPGISQISSLQVSGDGTRLAAIIVAGGEPALAVAGVVRDDAGVPVKLSDPVIIGTLPGDGLDLAWLDASTVGALAHDGDGITLIEQQVGGTAVQLDAPPSAVSLSGASTIASVRLRGDDGAIYLRRGSNWVQVGSGVQVLAHVQ